MGAWSASWVSYTPPSYTDAGGLITTGYTPPSFTDAGGDVFIIPPAPPVPTPNVLRTSGRATNPELFYDATAVIDSLNATLDSNSITRPSYDQITFTVSQTGATNIEIRRLVNYASYCVNSLEDVLGAAPYIMPTMFTSSATRATNWEMRSDLDIIAQQASWLADQ